MGTSEPLRGPQEMVKFCIQKGCTKTQCGNGDWKDDNHRYTMVTAGLVASMMAPYCPDHKPRNPWPQNPAA